MTLLQFLLFLHVTAVIVWLGGATLHLAMMGLVRREAGLAEQVKLLTYDNKLGPRLYIPASLLALLSGIALVLDAGYAWGESWITVGLAGWLIAFLTGILFFEPQSKKLDAILAAGDAESPAAKQIVERVERVAHIDLLVLFVVVFAMTTKLAF